MTEVTKNITVDLSRKGNTRIVFARQNDKGSRILNITLTDGGAPYFVPSGIVAVINFLRSDGENASFAATINEAGGVSYTLGLWPLAVEGSVRCSVSLYGDEQKKLTSSDFYLDVLDALYGEDDFTEDTDESDMTAIFSSIAALDAEIDEIRQSVSSLGTRVTTTASNAQKALNTVNALKAQAEAGAFKGEKGDPGMTEAEIKTYVDEQLGEVEAALDSIIAIQNSLIGGEGE